MKLHYKLSRFCAILLAVVIAFSCSAFTLSAAAYIVGDVNYDGDVNSMDALMILRSIVGLIAFDNEQSLCADIDGNGSVDSSDALYILRSCALLSDNPADSDNSIDGNTDNNSNVDFDTDEDTLAYINEVVRLVNKERTAAGLKELTLDTTLCKASAVRAAEIQELFSHTRPNGESFSTVFAEVGLTYKACAENIAAGQPTPAMVVAMWMNSEGHRANIMSEKYSKIGVGYMYTANSEYNYYWEQLFSD